MSGEIGGAVPCSPEILPVPLVLASSAALSSFDIMLRRSDRLDFADIHACTKVKDAVLAS